MPHHDPSETEFVLYAQGLGPQTADHVKILGGRWDGQMLGIAPDQLAMRIPVCQLDHFCNPEQGTVNNGTYAQFYRLYPHAKIVVPGDHPWPEDEKEVAS
jgi:hypothetical protein